MVIKNVTNPPTLEELQTKLEQRFPDLSFNKRSKNLLIAKKSNTAGANILIRKNKINVAGNFPTLGGTMIFTFSILLLGVLIPIIVYFAAYHKKMKAVEKEVGDFIREEYALENEL